MRACPIALGVVVAVAGCLPDNPSDDNGNTDPDTSTGDTGTTTGPAAGGPMLACEPGESCTIIAVAQTLDDRVEFFSPDHPDGEVFRGAARLDLKPNDPVTGDYAGELLDEPFGMAFAGGFFHVIVGHYPTREQGTLVSIPLAGFFEGLEVGAVVPTEDIFAGGVFNNGVVSNDFGLLEPIFLSHHQPSGRLLIGVFNNDLFDVETNWESTGMVLVIDPSDPGTAGTKVLTALDGEDCNGASQIVDIGADRVAVACDGNEAIAILDVSTIATGDVQTAADTISGKLCDQPALSERRLRYLAPDGEGGLVFPEGPTPLTQTDSAALTWIDANDCGTRGRVTVANMGEGHPGQLGLWAPGPTWLFTSGQGNFPAGNRGIYVARSDGTAELEVCGPIPGFDEHWTTPEGEIDPVALAIHSDGFHIAVGAGPFTPGTESDPGYGKLLWATLSGVEDPCSMTANVTDLSASAPIDAGDPGTWRRAPSVVVLREVGG